MMLELNVIRTRLGSLQRRKKALRWFRIFDLVCFVGSLLLIVAAYFVSAKVGAERQLLGKIESDIQLNKIKYNVAALEKEWLQHIDSLTLTDELLKVRTYWSAYLLDFEKLLPVGICVERLSIVPGPTGYLVLQAHLIALSEDRKGFERIDTFIGNLEKNPRFGAGVKLQAHERRTVNEKDMEAFTLQIPLAGAQ